MSQNGSPTYLQFTNSATLDALSGLRHQLVCKQGLTC